MSAHDRINDESAARLIAAAATYPASKAIEFAEYMAKSAEHLLEAMNVYAVTNQTDAELDSDDEGKAAAAEADNLAFEVLCDSQRALKTAVYEFRKRAAKVTT